MKPEDQLDHLIEGQYYQGSWRLVNDEELADGLAAAEQLDRLREIPVPPDFARRLEMSLRARNRALYKNRQTSPLPLPHHRSRRRNTGSARGQRAWLPALATAAVLLLAFTGLLALSGRSLPSSPLAGLKQTENTLRVTLASDPQSRAHIQLDLLRNALTDLSTEVNGKYSDADIKQALQIVATRTNDSRTAIAAVPAGTEHTTIQQNFNDLLDQEEQTLRRLLPQVDWPTRLLFTGQLGNLGVPVPVVTSGLVSARSGGLLSITLKGANFVPGVKLVVDGHPGGTVSQSSQGQLVASLNSADLSLSAYSHAFGVLNPDGTAAQIVLRKDTDHDGSGDGQNQYGTPDGDHDADDHN